ncbi:DNA-directed RNA polymerase I RPA12 [Toxoplasma gondii ME49]|uniref:DNA-directed RNA polymerase I subunit RPA12 n=6 Tax=Toxoplasma gondii TaxID=5811 RepID=B6KHL5_TOXGV|nr:DNA-directed RNA polymerase I RPA12 [Toxoplasma gondii ME49]ESS34452.1 DNA-directed RNA polymerase I RPA12 [Toxoplasma gondii VEG]KFG40604.1 DNA-directed RNA polymerase I RPA12 [Toxoplasma gondii GAB2-2007-GAL-DOM2]KFG44637.1 DNA-directed RNA polymerase I RPA12 [Toxoplasma gondii FOU]KYF50167.1 DNA-directed RNA polymerase I RPA12 [Toxoplasma gondii ARI]PIM04378.1 DNA-directed RNA polymerase I RPA12 [Toxoplasma gondii COUG]|eukprot:XP_002367338.1 DNA-directed RNA polymerase I RPA12 [Toxoplasma gondii ME49]
MPPPRPSSRSLSSDALLLAQAASSLVVPLGADSALSSLLPPESSPCQRLLHQSAQSLDDSVEYFALLHRLGDDAETVAGPAKFIYQGTGFRRASLSPSGAPEASEREDESAQPRRRPADARSLVGVACSQGVSYDWLLALGCLNCGRSVTVADDLLPLLEEEDRLDASAALVCRGCGHHIAPLHGANESDSLVDCMQQSRRRHQAEAADAELNGERKTDVKRENKGANRGDGGELGETANAATASRALTEDGVYLFGQRKQHRLGDFSKRWWQQRFLGERFGERLLEQQLRLVQAFSGAKKGVVCKETCEACGHGEAFFSTFQARSADEGMTVMYECVKCGHRRVFNN